MWRAGTKRICGMLVINEGIILIGVQACEDDRVDVSTDPKLPILMGFSIENVIPTF